MDVATVGDEVGLQLLEQIREMLDSVLAYLAGFVAEARRVDSGDGLGAATLQVFGRAVECGAQTLIGQRLTHASCVGGADVNRHRRGPRRAAGHQGTR